MVEKSKSSIFHIERIKAAFDDRRQRNPSYSLRSFARDLELSPSALSALLNGKKGISKQKALIVSQKIGLSRSEGMVFLLSVVSHHGKSPELRNQAKQKLQRTLEKHLSTEYLTKEAFSNLDSWHDFALMEALELSNCEHTVKWLARRLTLTCEQVEKTIKKLEKQKRIVFENGKYRSLFTETTTEFDVPNDGVKEYHSSLLTAARTSLYKQPLHQREFLNMTLAFHKEDLTEAKDFIRNFQEQFAERFYPKNKTKDAVYQLSVQWFRLDQEGG